MIEVDYISDESKNKKLTQYHHKRQVLYMLYASLALNPMVLSHSPEGSETFNGFLKTCSMHCPHLAGFQYAPLIGREDSESIQPT